MSIQKVVTEMYGPEKGYCLVQQFHDNGAVRYFYFAMSALPLPELIEVRPMTGLLGDYFLISRDGKVFSTRTKRRMATCFSTGYEAFTTRLEGRSGKAILVKIHQAVARVFVDNPRMLPHVNHKDGIKENNNDTNLEWCTQAENTKHAVENNLIHYHRGESHHQSKVDATVIAEIRTLKLERKSNRAIGRLLNLHHTTVGQVVAGTHPQLSSP